MSRVYKCDTCGNEYKTKKISYLDHERYLDKTIREDTFKHYDFCSSDCFRKWWDRPCDEEVG